MFRWLSGKLVLQNFRRGLRYVHDNFGVNAARDCCETVLRQIFFVKHAAKLGTDAELRAATDAYSLVKDATSSNWLARPQTSSAAVGLLEEWLSARIATLNGSLDSRVFFLIDDELWSFAKDRLKPIEIEANYDEVAAKALLQRRQNASEVIDGLIRDYAEISRADAVSPPPLATGPQESGPLSGEAIRG